MRGQAGRVNRLENRTALAYKILMRIASVRHRGLRRLLENDDARGLRADMARRVRNILAALIAARDMDGVNGPPGWRIHKLTRIGQEPGAFRRRATGVSRSGSTAMRSSISIWRTITDG
jgi:hypothetical protein